MKGLIAALIGVGLLGGYGTFALWSDSKTVTSGDITAGNLDISIEGTPGWSDISPDGADGWTGPDVLDEEKVGDAKPIDDISKFLMVPGDLLQYEAAVTIIATGSNMKAQLVVDPGSVDIPVPLTDNIDILAILRDSNDAIIDSAPLGTPIDIDSPADGVPYTIQVRVGFDGETSDQDDANLMIDLSDLSFDLKQVRS